MSLQERPREIKQVGLDGRTLLVWNRTFPVGFVVKKDGQEAKYVVGVGGFLRGRREYWGQERPVFGDEEYRGRDAEEEHFQQTVERERQRDWISQLKLAEQYAKEFLGPNGGSVYVCGEIPVEFEGHRESENKRMYRAIETMMTGRGFRVLNISPAEEGAVIKAYSLPIVYLTTSGLRIAVRPTKKSLAQFMNERKLGTDFLMFTLLGAKTKGEFSAKGELKNLEMGLRNFGYEICLMGNNFSSAAARSARIQKVAGSLVKMPKSYHGFTFD